MAEFVPTDRQAALIRKANAGDRTARFELGHSMLSEFLRAARQFSNNEDEADDLASESLALFGKSRVQINNPRSYLWKIVSRKSIDRGKARALRPIEEKLPAEGEHDEDDAVSRSVAAEISSQTLSSWWEKELAFELADHARKSLAGHIRKLRPIERQILALKHEGELDSAEIAKIVGIPPGTVRSKLFKLHRKLEKSFGKDPRNLAYADFINPAGTRGTKPGGTRGQAGAGNELETHYKNPSEIAWDKNGVLKALRQIEKRNGPGILGHAEKPFRNTPLDVITSPDFFVLRQAAKEGARHYGSYAEAVNAMYRGHPDKSKRAWTFQTHAAHER